MAGVKAERHGSFAGFLAVAIYGALPVTHGVLVTIGLQAGVPSEIERCINVCLDMGSKWLESRQLYFMITRESKQPSLPYDWTPCH